MNDTHVPGTATAEILQRVFDSVDVMLAYLDRDFNFVKVNRAYAAADGRAPDFFPGLNHFTLYPDAENEAIFRRVVATGEPYSASERPFSYAEHPERGTSWWDWLLQPIKDAGGRVGALVLSLTNVTEKVRARREAERAAAYARGLIEASIDPLVTIGIDGRITDVNAATEQLTGHGRDALVGTDFSDYFIDAASARAAYQRAFAEGTVRDYTLDIRRADGATVPVLYNATVYRDRSGAVAGVFAAARDVTRLRKAEEALRSAGRYNRSLIEASLDPLVTIGTDGRIMDVNAATEKATGRRRDALIGTDFSDYFTAPDQARAGYERVFREGFVRDYPLEIRHVDGHTTPVLYNASVYRDEQGAVAGVFAAARDIAERTQAEHEAHELARRNGLILESAGEGIYGLDTEGRCTFVNPAAARMLGFSVEELAGQSMHALIHHSYEDGTPYPLSECPINDAWRDKVVRRGADFYWRKDRSGFSVEYVSTPIIENGNSLGSVVTFRDITERRKAEEELRAASKYARSLIEASLDPLVTIGADGRITDVNGATEKATGRDRQSLVGTDFSDYFTEPGRARAGYEEVFREGFVRDYALEIRHRDGHTTPVLYNASVYRDEEARVAGVFAAARDVTERRRAEEALRRAGRYNRSLIEASLDPLVTIGADGRITDVNGATEQATGRAREGLIGTDFSDYFTAPAQARAGYERAFREGFVRDFPLEIRHTDGHTTPVLYNASLFRDEHGAVAGVFAAARDISGQRRAERAMRDSEARYRSLFERMFDGYLVAEILLDEREHPVDYRFLEVNPAFERLTGIRRADAIGHRVREVVKDPSEESIAIYGDVALKGEGRRFESYSPGLDRYFDLSAFPLAPRQFAAVFTDVTERRRAEQAQQELNRELERRVQERTASLEEANRELESFSYSVSHDLRTPLRAVDGFSRLLLEQYGSQLDDEGRRLLHVVRDNSERMAQLISDILSFSRTGRAELKTAQVDMTALAREVWEEVRLAEPERSIDFQLAALPPAQADRNLVRQILVNLLGNAVKFTRPRPDARIEVGGRSNDGENLYWVRDNGVGFDMQYVSRLFGVFQRLHSGSDFEGTGIGLAIVKRITARHGGRVWAEGKPGEGATFFFTLPKVENP